MWKILVGFILFAGLALFVIFKGGDKVDMQGEAGSHAPAAEQVTPANPPDVNPAPASLPAAAQETSASK